ncbi:MAG TPA: O-antigen polymerase [Pyrinomonadaceae bacterium]|jgi:oligosaccharide repeat unit polymerase|nr:O-antigen polymerase [Pyrinomonadaceae bacterium]
MKIRIASLSAERVTALLFAAVIVFSIGRWLLIGGTMPLLWPISIATVSAAVLFIPFRSQLGPHFMRVGFYVGMFAFFLSYPILSPDEVNPNISSETHSILGWALFLTVVGFELTYRLLARLKDKRLPMAAIKISRPQRSWLLAFVFLGMACWFFSVWDYANALNAPFSSVLLTMRGVVEGSQPAGQNYLAIVLGAGIFLAATAAALLLSSDGLPKRAAIFCWPVIVACAAVGFLGGSRAGFLYSFVPLAVVGWKKLSKLPFSFVVRALGALCAFASVVVIWSAMSAMRGADIRDYEGGIDDISPVMYAQGALDIYSMTAEVVDTFPAKIPYVQGESLLPLVFGLVPRPLWPDKPYPFGLYMNIVNGESLQARSASLAVGLTGEGYGNFGLFGACLWGAMLGLGCRFGDRYLARFDDKSPMRSLLGLMAAVWVSMIVRGGVPEMFYMGLQVIALPLALAAFLSPRWHRISISLRFSQSAHAQH